VLAHVAPLPALRCYAPAAPEIELAVDDGCTVRFEDDTGILPALLVREPILADIHNRAVRGDLTIEIEETEVFRAQKCRHAVDVMLAARIVLDLLEP